LSLKLGSFPAAVLAMELSPLFVRLCVWAVLVCLIQHVWAFHEKREVNPTLSDMSPRDVAWSKSFVPYRPNALGSTVKAGTRFLHILNPYAATDKDLIATFHITMASLDIARQWSLRVTWCSVFTSKLTGGNGFLLDATVPFPGVEGACQNAHIGTQRSGLLDTFYWVLG
jgi:hypothetical protein